MVAEEAAGEVVVIFSHEIRISPRMNLIRRLVEKYEQMNRILKTTEYRKAVVLVAVLWIVIVLTLIVTVVAQSGMIDTRISHVAAERIKCKWACRAGVEMAIASLNDDELLGGSDSLFDAWNDGVGDFNSVPLDGCTFSVEVIDEASKLNLNTVTREQLLWVPDMTEEIADSIIDWRDSDDDISVGGAESGYYVNLPFGYEARNGNFKTVRELLLVKGVTQGLFFGDRALDETVTERNKGWVNYFTCYSYDLGTDAGGNAQANADSANENQPAAQAGNNQSNAASGGGNQPAGQSGAGQSNDASAGGETGSGKVNVNTASEDVLIALAQGDEQIAYDIIAYRQSLADGIENLDDLRATLSISDELADELINSLTTRSSVYMIRSTAKANATGIRRTLEAVVDREKSPAEILYYRAGAIN